MDRTHNLWKSTVDSRVKPKRPTRQLPQAGLTITTKRPIPSTLGENDQDTNQVGIVGVSEPRPVSSTMPATEPVQQLTPEHLAQMIREKHQELQTETLERYRDLGQLLLKAKSVVGHGNFLSWVKANCMISSQSARDYMKIAQYWNVLEVAVSNSKRALNLSLREAKRLINEASREKIGDGPASHSTTPTTLPYEALALRKCRRSISRSYGPTNSLPSVSDIGINKSILATLRRLPPLHRLALMFELSNLTPDHENNAMEKPKRRHGRLTEQGNQS